MFPPSVNSSEGPSQQDGNCLGDDAAKKNNTASSAGKEAVWMLEGLSLKNNETDLQINQCGFLGNLNTYQSDNWANSPAEDQKEP